MDPYFALKLNLKHFKIFTHTCECDEIVISKTENSINKERKKTKKKNKMNKWTCEKQNNAINE